MIAITVIIPVYNGEKTISETLESVLKQTYNNFEIVIVNDGSTDTTQVILNDYAEQDSRIKVISQKNSGVSAARNNGIVHSEGKYVCFLDADDMYSKTFLEKMYEKITKNNMDICYCGYNVLPITKNNEVRKKYDVFTYENILENYIKGRLPAHTSTWLIKSSVIKNNNILFEENVSWGEDQEFFYKVLACSNKVTFVSEYLTFYRNEELESRLSYFSLDKIDQDYDFIMRVVNNSFINRDSKIEKSLLEYKLPALLTYNLLIALASGYSRTQVLNYYEKYKKYLSGYEWVNGFRSLKLNLSKVKLKIKLC